MMKLLPKNHILFELAAIARDAGQEIMPFFRASPKVRRKPDGSPVTHADQAAERLIIEKLLAGWPDIPAVGEESAAEGGEDVSRYERYWLIDPLDGTHDFINDRDEFTVNIALVENGLPVLGVVYAPAKDLMYLGDVAQGSYKVTPGGQLRRLSAVGSSGELIVAISRSHPTKGKEEAFLDKLKELHSVKVLRMGSSLKFCMVAEGIASMYFRAGTTMFWDSAAGHAVAKGAGAIVRRWESADELIYLDSTLVNPSFVVVCPEWENLADTILRS